MNKLVIRYVNGMINKVVWIPSEEIVINNEICEHFND